MRILIVEDDRRLAELLARRLRREGHEVTTCGNGNDGLEETTSRQPDLLVLDVMLPGLDGVSLTRELRGRDIDVPVLLLTARDTVEDRVRGLQGGADDYLVKPFAFAELVARIDALGRRGRRRLNGVALRHGPVSIDVATRRAWAGGTEVDLTVKEFELLRCFLEHRGQVLTRAELKHIVWDFSFDADTRVVDLYVHYLRRKLGPDGDIIRTVRGVGYAVDR